MKKTYINSSFFKGWKNAAAMLAMLVGVSAGTAMAQEGSQGNITIFAGARMTFHGNHSFTTGGTGALPGIINTERTTSAIGTGYGALNFASASLTVTGANDANHVDGYVSNLGAGQFVYPVGDNGFFGPFAATGAGTTGAYFHADPNVAVTSNLAGGNYAPLPTGAPFSTASKAADVVAVSTIEYWDIDGSNASKISLTWDAGSAIGTLIGGTNLALVGIVGWDGSKWVKIPATVDATSVLGGTSDLTAGSITSNSNINLNGFTAYTLASVLGNMPDLTPAQFFSDQQLSVNETVDYVVAISNVGPNPTTAPFVFTVTNFGVATGLTMALNSAATVNIAGDDFTLSNSDFDVVTTAARFTFTSKAGVVLPKNGVINVAFKITRTGGGVGSTNSTVTITNGTGGGETPTNNNTIANPITKN